MGERNSSINDRWSMSVGEAIMSSPVHNPKDLDDALMYAPPWARRTAIAVSASVDDVPVESAPTRPSVENGGSPFVGNRAMLARSGCSRRRSPGTPPPPLVPAPDATLHVSESPGRDVGLDRSSEIMSVLASNICRAVASMIGLARHVQVTGIDRHSVAGCPVAVWGSGRGPGRAAGAIWPGPAGGRA